MSEKQNLDPDASRWHQMPQCARGIPMASGQKPNRGDSTGVHPDALGLTGAIGISSRPLGSVETIGMALGWHWDGSETIGMSRALSECPLLPWQDLGHISMPG